MKKTATTTKLVVINNQDDFYKIINKATSKEKFAFQLAYANAKNDHGVKFAAWFRGSRIELIEAYPGEW